VFRRTLTGVLVAALLLLATTGAAGATPEPPPGYTRGEPIPSPRGLFLRASHGFGVIIGAVPPERGEHARVSVEIEGREGTVRYSVDGNPAGEGIRADLGRFGHLDLRWVPNGNVREIHGKCSGYPWHEFFDAGAYVGTVDIHGGDGFTEVTAHRVAWRPDWYGPHARCGIGVSEGFPGPGAILEAGHAHDIFGPIHLFVVQDAPGARVSYSVRESEHIGRIAVTHSAFAVGGPKTISVGPGFRTGEISPPFPFSGTGRFERIEHATGTWLGDLGVEFLDHKKQRLAGKSFEGIFHSGYYELHEM
jgi:hypothetical protein